MASMPVYHVSKGPFHILDDLFGDPATCMAAYNNVLTGAGGNPALDSGNAITTLTARTNAKVPTHLKQSQRDHFVNDWLGGGWWAGLMVPETLRLGMLEAIKYAQAANLPMEFFWICVQAAQIFEIYYGKNDRQVTVLLLTPAPPAGYHPGPLSGPEDLWVVRQRVVPWDANYPTINGTPSSVGVPAPVSLVGTAPNDIIKQQIWHE